MTQYKSKFTGPEIDAGIEKAGAAEIAANEALSEAQSAKQLATSATSVAETAASAASTASNTAASALSLAQSAASSAEKLPTVDASDNGKVLKVVDGVWTAVAVPTYTGEITIE